MWFYRTFRLMLLSMEVYVLLMPSCLKCCFLFNFFSLSDNTRQTETTLDLRKPSSQNHINRCQRQTCARKWFKAALSRLGFLLNTLTWLSSTYLFRYFKSQKAPVCFLTVFIDWFTNLNTRRTSVPNERAPLRLVSQTIYTHGLLDKLSTNVKF